MTEYTYNDASATYANAYLWPALKGFIASRDWPDRRAFDLGCGNGATSRMLMDDHGFSCAGIDASESGIAQARHNGVAADVGSAYDDLAARYGRFPLVVSLEVIEHCMEPRAFARTAFDLIAPGGCGFISTPYHGYWKNLALAVTGKMDAHFTVLWDGGHIKFFSIATMRQLMAEIGATELRFVRVGRLAPFAKSMVCIIDKPA